LKQHELILSISLLH